MHPYYVSGLAQSLGNSLLGNANAVYTEDFKVYLQLVRCSQISNINVDSLP